VDLNPKEHIDECQSAPYRPILGQSIKTAGVNVRGKSRLRIITARPGPHR
jgi:hypothetical protein